MDRTVRVKLNTTPEQAYALKETLASFTNALNAVCEYGWQNTERNGVRLHHETYYPIKALKDSEFVASEQVIGVDLGLNRPAVTSGRAFLGKRAWKDVDKRYFRLKRALQSKGSKTARRHLRKLAGKQLRFHRDCDHVLSKRIVQSAIPGATIVVENLTDIRQRARLRRGEGQRRLHAWSFRQLRSFLEYKAGEGGMCVVSIDPRHTSQTCSNCGFQHRSNRRSQSLFLCRSCGYSLNADLNASRNIRDKHLVALGIPLGYGPPSSGLSSQAPA